MLTNGVLNSIRHHSGKADLVEELAMTYQKLNIAVTAAGTTTSADLTFQQVV
jgi:short-subunit dehydrogenase involved in D-alanine esterification of teichoic acids